MSNSNLLTGKVASIINERELTINIGTIKGVQLGMKFKVLADSPLEVHDPESNELLGIVDREKVRVLVTEVYDRFSVCKTYLKHTVGGGGYLDVSSSIAAAMLSSQSREVVETLKAKDQKAFPPPLSEEESYVKRGDRVIAIPDKE